MKITRDSLLVALLVWLAVMSILDFVVHGLSRWTYIDCAFIVVGIVLYILDRRRQQKKLQ